ncbi:hypothetical protein KIPB_005246 [Kipferlia bialata]|uniref:Uncharacterized protein n=1 Tax=Kipferlia bialata TaxID=797122 RepID=A0A391NRC1_9EUKA|nr:hypothetical protein KIPB_005246 [Kipferlia bialata]|eukprot:g5246.t1
MWRFDPERQCDGWVLLNWKAPQLHPFCAAYLPVIGERAYALNASQQVVSFRTSVGWDCESDTVFPKEAACLALLAVGRLLLMCFRVRFPFVGGRTQWYCFDTVSNDAVRFSDNVPDSQCGIMFSPALAVRPGYYRDTLDYIDPGLEYPHTNMRWAVLPPGAVIVADDAE